MTNILYVPHGQTPDNLSKVASGKTRDPGLTGSGMDCAARTGEKLVREHQAKILGIYTSSLLRAVQTAEIIAETDGLVGDDGSPLKVVAMEDLAEIDYGEMTGLNRAKVRDFAKDEYTRYPGGESTEDMLLRAARALNKIFLDNPEGTVVVVGHSLSTPNMLLLGQTFTQARETRHVDGYGEYAIEHEVGIDRANKTRAA